MPLPNDIQILEVIDNLSKSTNYNLATIHELISEFPEANPGQLVTRLNELSIKSNDVLENITGINGGYRITGHAGHASDPTVAQWILNWTGQGERPE